MGKRNYGLAHPVRLPPDILDRLEQVAETRSLPLATTMRCLIIERLDEVAPVTEKGMKK